MKLCYYCFGRAHSSVIAGWIHLNQLPDNRLPSIEEIYRTPGFDQSDRFDLGRPSYLGIDSQNNEVYIIGFGKEKSLALQTIYFTLNQLSNPTDWRFFDSLDEINWLTKVGGFLSRRMHLVKIGRYLAAVGVQQSYFRLVEFVKKAKELTQYG